jgi:23S rRNA (adenine2503-C2)-methyltransferase
MSKTNLIGLTKTELEALFVDLGQPAYRGRQAFKWLYGSRSYDFSQWTDMSKELRARLADEYTAGVLHPAESRESSDGTVKFLYRLDDGHAIESVLIPDPESGRRTVCVSSQAGCALGCHFCATGSIGFHRDLTVGEIISQLMALRDQYGDNAFTNIVFMGMGEPMLNLDAVLDSIGIITDGAGLAHAAKKITISTAGVVPGIRRLAALGSKVRLAVSLNAATQDKRRSIMPLARKYPLDDLAAALRQYTTVTGYRVTFEYALFEDFNDGRDDIKALIRLIQGIPCKINILSYNPVQGLPFRPPSPDKVEWFVQELYPHLPAVTVRQSRGADIEAACGQLAAGESKRRSQ